MRRLRLTAVLSAAVAVSTLVVSSASSATRTLDTSFASRALGGTLHFEVYLPAGYDSSGFRYPVLYFLHGLPASTGSYRGLRFVERALDEVGLPAILVVPQGARAGESDPEYVNHGPGDNWGDAIALELTRTLDHFDRQFGFVAVNKLLLGPEPEDSGLLEYLKSNLDIPISRVDLGAALAFDSDARPDPGTEWRRFHLIGASLRYETKAP